MNRTLQLALGCGALCSVLSVQAAVVVVDEQSGQLRAPTATERAALDRAAASERAAANKGAARAVAPVQKVHSNGAVELNMPDDTVMYSVARLNAQGKLEQVCVQGDSARDQALKTQSFATPPRQISPANSSRVLRATKEPLDEK